MKGYHSVQTVWTQSHYTVHLTQKTITDRVCSYYRSEEMRERVTFEYLHLNVQ